MSNVNHAVTIGAILSRGYRMIAASVLFYMPLMREFTLWFGAVDASKDNVERLLQHGVNIELYPGKCSALFISECRGRNNMEGG
jgi:hypothetical protein